MNNVGNGSFCYCTALNLDAFLKRVLTSLAASPDFLGAEAIQEVG
jgi:hypothetical protein